jgi:hypothetical protein
MFAVRIVEDYSLLFYLVSQYYSGRKGIGTKNKYDGARKRHCNYSEAAPFEKA